MKKKLATGVFALMVCVAAVAQDKKVAVFDPAGNGMEAFHKEIIREEISAIIVNTGGYTVLERQLINKVLEENKFQSGGLVDDSQISEIGKRMGANMVFVSNVTQMSNRNFYLSFKMIDVQTARIEKQKTAQTSRGADDLVTVVQKTVNEMFSNEKSMQAANRRAAGKEDDDEFERLYRESKASQKTGNLIADGRRIYLNGRELDKIEVQKLMVNTDALRMYSKGTSRTRKGNIWLITGGSLFVLGAICAIGSEVTAVDYYAGSTKETSSNEALSGLAMVGMTAGVWTSATGLIIKAVGKSNIRKSVDMYNHGGSFSSAELRFGVTRSGVGLTLNF